MNKPYKLSYYNANYIDGLLDYLSDQVKYGYVDAGDALDLVLTKKWKDIEKLRGKGDDNANKNER